MSNSLSRKGEAPLGPVSHSQSSLFDISWLHWLRLGVGVGGLRAHGEDLHNAPFKYDIHGLFVSLPSCHLGFIILAAEIVDS